MMKSRKIKVLALILSFALLCAVGTISAFAASNELNAGASSLDDSTIYEENFDTVTERVNINSGNNSIGAAKGWIFAKKSTDSAAYIENGRLYFSGSKYDVIYRDGGEVWGNYTLEADFCYTDATVGWGGMLYNVQSATKYQKAGITIANKYSLNGYDGKWTNDKSGVNKGFTITDSANTIGKGTPFRMKVVVHNKTASFYYAVLDESGRMKTEFIKLLTIDNIPANAQTGSIGFMTSNNSYASFWVDNIKCYSDSPVSYSENFDSYADITLAGDATNTEIGLYFEKNNTTPLNSNAEIKDGALYLYGGRSNYDAVFFTMGYNWTNYVVESDFTYLNAPSGLNNDGWAGILFRSTDIKNFYKGMVGRSNSSGTAQGVINGKSGGSWYINSSDQRGSYTGSVISNQTYRLRIVVNENTASLYMAVYKDGVLGDFTHVVTITDRFAPIHMNGTVGLIVGGGNNTRYENIKIDNVTVSRIPGADRMFEVPNAAEIYEPTTGIVNPPVVVEELTESLPATAGKRAAVVIAELDANLNVLDKNGEALISADDFIDTYRTSLIPAFVVDSEDEAEALAELIHRKELIDCYVIATEANAELVRRVRMANQTTKLISGALIFEDVNSPAARREALHTVADNMCYALISRAPLSEEAAFYFTARQIAAWSYADSAAEVYRGIANGYHGIVSCDSSLVYDVYESITEPTVSGKTVVIAHRGANTGSDVDYPENTLLGIRAAKEIWGADAIEIDFGLTKDKYVVIMHDSTVDRTTDGTGNVSDLTLSQIKSLTVDYVPGKETTVPTLEEVLVLAKELDVVLYCHVKDKNDANIAAFTHLVEKYDCSDCVVLFGATIDSYNSNTNRRYSGTAYNLANSPVVADGIVFTAGDKKILSGCENHLEGVVEMKKALNPYNYQPLFYPYSNQGDMWADESFYYQLSARGFVNMHSVTDGQAKMDRIALTGSGATGWLTNNLHLCDDYHYGIDLSEEKLSFMLGETLSVSKKLNLISGATDVNCELIQLDGKALVAVPGGYTLNEAGTVTVVYYVTRTTDGGSTYRVYSEPVEIAFVTEFAVTFKNYDGSILATGTYLYGDAVTVPENPSKASDNTFTYTFRGWDKDVVACEGNAVYTAVYDSHYIDYTVIFKNEDGTVLSSETYHYGDEVTAPKAPEKPLDKTYVYVFSGWDKPIGVCTADTTYTATFATRYIDYTVTFKNDDGTVLSSNTYHYGDQIVAPATPSRSSDAENYVFAGWDSTVGSCEGNKVYTATYVQVEQPAEEPVNPAVIVAIVSASAVGLGAGGFSIFRFVIRKKKH